MKFRRGFVSNSSSTVFIITNKTDGPLSLVEFAKETKHLVKEFNEEFHYKFTIKDFFKSAEARTSCILQPGPNELSFGDEDGDVLGHIYDYMLRDGGETQRFKWRFFEYNR